MVPGDVCSVEGLKFLLFVTWRVNSLKGKSSFIYSFYRYLLSNCYMLGIILGDGFILIKTNEQKQTEIPICMECKF